MEGLSPSKEDHQFFIDIQPVCVDFLKMMMITTIGAQNSKLLSLRHSETGNWLASRSSDTDQRGDQRCGGHQRGQRYGWGTSSAETLLRVTSQVSTLAWLGSMGGGVGVGGLHRVTTPRVALPLLPFSELQRPLPSEG